MLRADPGALLGCGLTGATWVALLLSEPLKGLILLTGFLREAGPDRLGDSLSMALFDSVGVNLVVGVWDNLPPGVELFPVLGSVAEETLGVWTPLSASAGIDLRL